MALVLCTGDDPVLMKTRQLVLEKAGHTVLTARDSPAVAEACERFKFDVAVVGQAMAKEQKVEIMALIRKHCPTTKVLELYRFSWGKVLKDADGWLEVPTNLPQDLAESVSALAGAG